MSTASSAEGDRPAPDTAPGTPAPDTARVRLTHFELLTITRGPGGSDLEPGAWLTMEALGYDDADDDPAVADRLARAGVGILYTRGLVAVGGDGGLVVTGLAARLGAVLRSARFWVRVAVRGGSAPRSALFTQTEDAFVLLDADLADTWRVYLSVAPELPLAGMVGRYGATLADMPEYEEVSVDVLDDDGGSHTRFVRDDRGGYREAPPDGPTGGAADGASADQEKCLRAGDIEARVGAFVETALGAGR
ncbi:hypothetical protein GCM10011490_02560 [Pseudoclavibacter endophyticus]|uniref:Uncharacterized protein n=1 Tax=Pseudoclavibacter endophyticus TaxID=1778590 RepID=A0A6H9WPZ4_9MICO|nr:hypothetical protein [Pseudoclavibacter endophyticus]KAB1650208.1 hypothetical protein F8O04_08430 [Pseudoclavibacter endophyticus]GGA56204.1 hypothetical protein GCM10011490_02560 [Pseudoclavibacter endophyticus]